MVRPLVVAGAIFVIAATGTRTQATPFGGRLKGAASRLKAVRAWSLTAGSALNEGAKRRFSTLLRGDARRLDRKGLDALGSKKIGAYFEEAKGDTARGLANLDDAVKTYGQNQRWLMGRWFRPWRTADTILAKWEEERSGIETGLKRGMTLGKLEEQDLDQLWQELFRQVKNPRAAETWGQRFKRYGMATLESPLRLARAIGKSTRSIAYGSMIAALGVSLVAPFIQSPIQRVTLPWTQYVEVMSQRYMGDVSIKMQSLVTKLDSFFQNPEVEDAVRQYGAVANRFKMGQLNRAEAEAEVAKLEHALMILSKNIKGVNTQGFNEGRGNQRDLVDQFLLFGNYMATVAMDLRTTQWRLTDMERQWRGQEPPPEIAADIAELKRHVVGYKRAIGAALAQWRINQILYPEYTQFDRTGDAKEAPLLRNYELLMKSLSFDEYLELSSEYYHDQLRQMGIHVKARQLAFIEKATPGPTR